MGRQAQSRASRSRIAIGSIIAGVTLGFAVVYGSLGVDRAALTAAATPSLAQRCQTNSRAGQVNAPMKTDSACIQACNDPNKPGKQNPKCICGQELGNADVGVTNCYNPGDCNPPPGLPACGSVEKPKLPEEQKGGEQGKGGEPKIPELPKGGGGGGQPKPEQPKDEECMREPKPEHCESSISKGLLDSLVPDSVKNLFSTNDATEPEGEQSALNKLFNFFARNSAGETNVPASAVHNPTEAVVSPVMTGSQAGITAQGNTQASGGATDGSPPITAAVTGFGSSQTETQATTGILTQASQVLAGIGAALKNLVGGLF